MWLGKRGHGCCHVGWACGVEENKGSIGILNFLCH